MQGLSSQFPGISFEFVSETPLQNILESHYQQAKAAFESGSWGGTIVLLGSVAEGLLTWGLSRPEIRDQAHEYHSQKYKGKSKEGLPIDKWDLSDLIGTAEHLGLIGRTAVQAAWAIKEFRNFIHPYRLLGQSARLDKALALSCLGSLLRITDSLKQRLA